VHPLLLLHQQLSYAAELSADIVRMPKLLLLLLLLLQA
jgi:hypothetical protein